MHQRRVESVLTNRVERLYSFVTECNVMEEGVDAALLTIPWHSNRRLESAIRTRSKVWRH